MIRIVPLTDVYPWELNWLKILFAEFGGVELLKYTADVPVENNALYLFNSDKAMVLSPEFLSSLGDVKGAGLLHIGDEYLRSDLRLYTHFDYIIRMFPFSRASKAGVFNIPVGHTPNLGPGSVTPASERKYPWMFGGDWKADRARMEKHFSTWKGGLLSMPMPYQDEGRISREAYLEGMANAAFAPCPAGNILLETCRPYEALHFGAIPILPKRRRADPYKELLGSHPLPVFEHWDAALHFAKDVYASPERLDSLQSECIDWWGQTKKRLGVELKQFVESGRAGEYKQAIQTGFANNRISKVSRVRELLAHQNSGQLSARAAFQGMKLARVLGGQPKAKPTWSLSKDDVEKSRDQDD